jgi:hypothetical protein
VGAHILFVDESGLLMVPLLRRSWCPRGHPSQLFHRAMAREKVSIAGAIVLSPRRRRVRLLFQLLIKAYFNNVRVADFLHGLACQLRGPIIVVWDGGTMHKGDPIREALHQLSPRVTLEPLPPYAPMLNPCGLGSSTTGCRTSFLRMPTTSQQSSRLSSTPSAGKTPSCAGCGRARISRSRQP